jgi:FtsP/CotA-like multicopper oxidase with cupredoxin domain
MAEKGVRCSRRSFLRAIANAGLVAGAARMFRTGVALGGPGTVIMGSRGAHAGTNEILLQPAEIRSESGILSTTLRAAPGTVRLGELAFPGFLYNDAYMPPLLRVRRGDTIRITFKNAVPSDPSNLHFHGMSVSPQGNSDNVFVHVHPGRQFDYEVHVPKNGRQGPGLFWYHPHAHGVVAKQMLGGMSGALVVDGSEELFPFLNGLPERFLLFKHAEIGEGNETISINGQLRPIVKIRPGEVQFWRIANIGATLFLKFRAEGVQLYTVATDGHPVSQPRRINEFFLGPGERIDTIAVGPPAGKYAVTTIPFQSEAWNKPAPAQQLATIVSAGPAASAPGIESEILAQRVQGERWIDEVRSAAIAHRRTLTYSRTPDRSVFMINGHVMEDGRVDETIILGDTEEWTVINTDQQYHSFHIHQTAFLVTEVNGVRQNEDSLRDTFSILPATVQAPSTLKVVIPFTDPVIVGRFVYHCHAVDHEDKGMMGVIEVVKRNQR